MFSIFIIFVMVLNLIMAYSNYQNANYGWGMIQSFMGGWLASYLVYRWIREY